MFCLPIFSIPCIRYLLYLIFRFDFDVMENLETLEELNTGADAAISRGMASGSSVAKSAAALTMRTAAWEATSSFVRL